LFISVPGSVQPDVAVTDLVARLGPARQVVKPALAELGDGVEPAPGRPGAELLMPGLPPLMEDTRDPAGGDDSAVQRADGQVMGLGVVQPSTPVCLYRGEVVNAIVWDNTAASSNHQFSGTAVRYSSAPDLVHGMDGNITNAPRFISATDYRLGPESACIDAGSDLEVATGVDLAGKPRIVGTAVDLGAFEHAYGGDIEGLPVPIPELWMVLHGFSGDLSAAAWADQDLDGSATWAEYVAGTKPTDSSSVLRVDMLMISTNETALVAWQPSVSGRTNRVISGPSPQTAHSTVAVVPYPASAVTTAVESASSAIFVVEALMEAAP
jgi:hypothetical protein